MRKFTLGLNAAKSTNYIEKYFKQKLCKIIFPTKNSMDAYVYRSQGWIYGTPKMCLSGIMSLSTSGVELGGSKDLLFLKYYNALK